ncbi:MAG: hypothetical protein IT379_01880 [Deltaproteobacteria bacterium]|nr:hypothetical protein [Deltaproteobacteria bacterium]
MRPSSHVVAVTRWNEPAAGGVATRDQLVGPLAALLKRDAYEMRTRLAAPLPVIVATVQDRTLADATHALLRAAGHGVVTCDAASAMREAAPIVLEHVEILGNTLVGIGDRARIELPLAHLQVVIEAMQVRSEGTSAQPVTMGIPGRRGMSLLAVAQTGRRGEKLDVERVLYLVRRSESTMLVVGEGRTHFVGTLHRATRRDSLLELVRAIRERAPLAIHDVRLATQKRPTLDLGHQRSYATGAMPGHMFTTQVESASNVSGTDLAAHLLALAHRTAQI